MVRSVPLLLLIFLTRLACAQCGYTVSLLTNKDYCLGSSLVAHTKHTLERIVWYKDGKPIDSALATQSIASTPTAIQIPGVYPSDDLVSDNNGNIYTYDPHRFRIIRWTVATGLVTDVVTNLNNFFTIDASGLLTNGDRLFIDPQGNCYASDLAGHKVFKFAPGSTTGILVASRYEADENPDFGNALYVDCQENLYVSDASQHLISKWAPGAASGITVAGGNGSGFADNQLRDILRLFGDSLGNLYMLDQTQLKEWPAGAVSGIVLSNFNGAEFSGAWDFWRDGKDTFYLMGSGRSTAGPTAVIAKWYPGAASPSTIGSINAPNGFDGMDITVDSKGNIFATVNTDSTLYEFTRTSSIDSTFTPTDTGVYYAVVTDMQGYTMTTNKITINDPSAGPPGISITATATSTPVCTPITFTATPVNPGLGPSYQWMVSGVPVGDGSLTYSNNLFADSDQVYCIMQAQAGCAGPVTDTSNIIQLSIDPHGTASVKIYTPKDSVCIGDNVVFTAVVTNGSNNPTSEWLLNGVPTTDNTNTYSSPSFANGDVITCLITSDDVCGLAKSNSIPLTVSTPPSVESGEVVTILLGQSKTLDPVITGDASTFLWTPGIGLSDSTIENPVASPDSNTLYTLTVTAAGGCTAKGTILVNVYVPLSLPGAFTPNGDGHNDVFYVLGGPINSRVAQFAVYDRYGAQVFGVHNVAPGDPSFGWNGTFHGSPAPTGTYVYFVTMQYADGHRQTYKGTVILIR